MYVQLLVNDYQSCVKYVGTALISMLIIFMNVGVAPIKRW